MSPDIFQGILEWNRTYIGAGLDAESTAIIVDTNKNVYISGYSYGSSSYDVVTIKYDGSGNELWNRSYNGGNDDLGYGIALDLSNNVYIVGDSKNGTNRNILLLKYDSNGNYIWNRTYDSLLGNDFGKALVIDSSNNLYVMGAIPAGYVTIKYNSSGDLIWNKSFGGEDIALDLSYNFYITKSVVGQNFFFEKYDSDGNFILNGTYDGGASENSKKIQIDSENNVLLLGGISAINDVLLVKFNNSGTQLWNKTYDGGLNDWPGGLKIGSNNEVYISISKNAANSDILILKYNSGGTELWNKTYDGGNTDVTNNIFIDSSENIYSAGYSILPDWNWHYIVLKYT